MKKLILIVGLIGFMLGGCGVNVPKNNKSEIMKNNIVEISGVVQNKTGDEWMFLKNDGEIVNVTSQKIDLENYVGKNIKVTGMFSGSTLYIDKIE